MAHSHKRFVIAEGGMRWLILCPFVGDTYAYGYDICVIPDSWFGRLIKRFFDWVERWRPWVCRYDLESLDVKEGDIAPMYSGTYWFGVPNRIASRYCRKLNPEFYKSEE